LASGTKAKSFTKWFAILPNPISPQYVIFL
jgi:hypothetical protein